MLTGVMNMPLTAKDNSIEAELKHVSVERHEDIEEILWLKTQNIQP